MDNVKDLLLKASTQFQIFFSTLHIPYRHSTIEGVYQDPDIENQYERLCVSAAVVAGNVSVNTLVTGIYLIKNLGLLSMKYMNEYLQPVNEVNIVEGSEETDEYEVVTDKKND